jgi:hypothetical protein
VWKAERRGGEKKKSKTQRRPTERDKKRQTTVEEGVGTRRGRPRPSLTPPSLSLCVCFFFSLSVGWSPACRAVPPPLEAGTLVFFFPDPVHFPVPLAVVAARGVDDRAAPSSPEEEVVVQPVLPLAREAWLGVALRQRWGPFLVGRW